MFETIKEESVREAFKRVNVRETTGPDGLSGWILKTCSEQLAVVFGKQFNWSMMASKVPLLWKTSIVCPVPKRSNPKTLNNFHPVAVTSPSSEMF